MRRLIFPVLVLVTFFCPLGSAMAWDPGEPLSCQNYPQPLPNYTPPQFGGVDLTINVPSGGKATFYYFRARSEVSWIMICASGSANPLTMFKFASFGTYNAKGPYYITSIPNTLGTLVVTHVSDRDVREWHDVWNGVVREDTAWGSVFKWFDSAGPGEPNTYVYVCVQPSAVACPYRKLDPQDGGHPSFLPSRKP